jgi:hypothetical protein
MFAGGLTAETARGSSRSRPAGDPVRAIQASRLALRIGLVIPIKWAGNRDVLPDIALAHPSLRGASVTDQSGDDSGSGAGPKALRWPLVQLLDFSEELCQAYRNARPEAPGSICARYAGNGILGRLHEGTFLGFVLSG